MMGSGLSYSIRRIVCPQRQNRCRRDRNTDNEKAVQF